MTELDAQIKSMVESGMIQTDIMKEAGISYFAFRKSIEKTRPERPLPKSKSGRLNRFNVKVGSMGAELNTLADFEVKALFDMCAKRNKCVASALLDFWLEHTDI